MSPDDALVGMGLRPFGDPGLTDEFSAEPVAIDATGFHTYAAEWTPDGVTFSVDDQVVKTSRQSPGYPMQLMLGVYEFEPGGTYPKLFEIDYVRGYRLR